MSIHGTTMMVPAPANRTENELRSFLAAVRIRLADTMLSTEDESEWVSGILAAASVEACLRLAAAWAAARDEGLSPDRFTTEEKLILEMVESVYAPPRTAPGTAAVIARLVDDLRSAEAA